MNIFHMILNNWKAKVICLILATVLWYLLRLNVQPEFIQPLPAFPERSYSPA